VSSDCAVVHLVRPGKRGSLTKDEGRELIQGASHLAKQFPPNVIEQPRIWNSTRVSGTERVGKLKVRQTLPADTNKFRLGYEVWDVTKRNSLLTRRKKYM
jgi:hypothetical protein